MATAIQLLNQRQDEDWLRGWDAQGKLSWQLSAKGLAAAASRAQAWLEQQDWSQLRCHPRNTARNTAREDEAFVRESAIALPSDWSHLSSDLTSPPDLAITQPVIFLAIADTAQFLAWFSAISSLGYPLFLGDPMWGLHHWQQMAEGLAPDLVISDTSEAIANQFHWTAWPVDNSAFLWEKSDFPQILTTCGKSTDPNAHELLHDFKPGTRLTRGLNGPWIGIPTGGSMGQLRFALHRWNSLTASVSGLQQSNITAADGVIHSCCMLPLHHVSGLMQFLRSLLSGGQFESAPWSLVKQHFYLGNVETIGAQKDTILSSSIFCTEHRKFFLSLVPTQLQQLLGAPRAQAWIACFNTVLLGGAPAWPALLDRARAACIRLAPTYGMTETASQVITLHPDDFLRGQSGCGKLLPHAQIDWVSTSDPGMINVSDQSQPRKGVISQGLFKLRAHSLAWGYYSIAARSLAGEAASASAASVDDAVGGSVSDYVGEVQLWSAPGSNERSLVTDDLGSCDGEGYFYVVGRASTKVISGGENVFPAVVEAVILGTDLVEDVVVLGIEDAQWGERVVAVVKTATVSLAGLSSEQKVVPAPDSLVSEVVAAIAPVLSPAQRPKQWLVTDSLPRNAQGKIQRRQLEAWVLAKGKIVREDRDCGGGR